MHRTALSIIATLLALVGQAPAADDDSKLCATPNQTDKAIEACNRLIAAGNLKGRDLAVVLSNRAAVWRYKSDWDRAIADHSEALRNDPGYAKAFDGRGDVFIQKADHDRALADFNELVRLEPTQSSYIRRATAHYFKGNFDWALADLDEAAKKGPENFVVYSIRGLVLRFRGDLDQAIANIDKAITINPKFDAGYANRCAVLRAKGDLDRALDDCDSALRMNKLSNYAFAQRCAVRLERGELDGAIEDCNQAIKLNEKFPTALTRRGLAYERKGDIERARADYQASLAVTRLTPETRKEQDIAQRRLAALAAAPAVAQPPQQTARVEPKAAAPAPEPKAGAPVPAPQVAALPPAAATVDQGRRVALVIGNSAYKSAPVLPNPKRDADAVAAALRRIGFQTVTLEADLGKEKLIAALRAFARESEKADWSLVYYAGHGIEVSGVNYLIPVDAKLETDRDIGFEAVPLDHVLAAVEGARRLRLVLLDACRDNPFANQMRRTIATRSIGRGLAAVEPEAGTLVVYAAKHGEAALDGKGDNSPFAAALVKNLNSPGLEVRRLFDVVRDDVMEATSKRQQPFSYGSVPGRQDFFFVAR